MQTTQKTTKKITDAIESEINDMQQLADEIRVKINLGSKDVRDGWEALELRLINLSAALDREGKQLKSETRALARSLRDDLRTFLASHSG